MISVRSILSRSRFFPKSCASWRTRFVSGFKFRALRFVFWLWGRRRREFRLRYGATIATENSMTRRYWCSIRRLNTSSAMSVTRSFLLPAVWSSTFFRSTKSQSPSISALSLSLPFSSQLEVYVHLLTLLSVFFSPSVCKDSRVSSAFLSRFFLRLVVVYN